LTYVVWYAIDRLSFREGKIVKELPVNEKIRAKEVLLIGEKGERLDVMPLYKALQIAREHNLDLVEVASTAAPPVCRLLDYGKYKYEQAKKERETRKSRKASLVREVRLRPRIEDHDLESKIRLIERLLAEGDKVKVTVFFRGREITRPELGRKVLQGVLNRLKDKAVVDQPLAIEERRLSLFFAPAKSTKKVVTEASGAQD
jgi:translation initiation factor IF-3